MSGTIYYTRITDLCGNHQRLNLNRIANKYNIIDIPIHFESSNNELNTFSVGDSQGFLNTNSDLNLSTKQAFFPYGGLYYSDVDKIELPNHPSTGNHMNFVTYDDISFQNTGLANLNKDIVINRIYLRNNPYGSYNLTSSNQLDPSLNTVFSNTINYLEIDNNKGGIIKRSENFDKDSSSNIQIFLSEVSNNLITSRSLGDPFQGINFIDFSFNQRNFANLFPSNKFTIQMPPDTALSAQISNLVNLQNKNLISVEEKDRNTVLSMTSINDLSEYALFNGLTIPSTLVPDDLNAHGIAVVLTITNETYRAINLAKIDNLNANNPKIVKNLLII